ncbi:hypothetical protein O0I10_002078 [Lichtheimia ornata]|uniref:Neutral ceramidase n=1 Tax=Lichtheimia ornata TaxID=688661 RepID=A0AAD7VB64_9FUNG|nr:uncharacterized protein O0I10_002078 [Lichtheimia ornata]KAJ8662384.1 hypothetical protein O0I10_002078 [Lichtheimia ornata]
MLLVRSLFLLIYALLCWISTATTSSEHDHQTKGLKVGVGMGDITGPAAEITMMGYADLSQTGKGILQRIFARAFIIANDDDRIVFVNSDTAAVGDIVKKRVVKKLQALYGNKVYTEKNVMISSTHNHNSMGGYLQHAMYEISVLGWIEETTKPMVEGIVNAIVRAHDHLQDGTITVSRDELLNTSISRSPAAYLLNPKEERAEYKYDVDKEMTLLGFRDQDGNGLGFLNWFAVHGVSINKTNHLVNGDNKGYAAYAAEKHYNPGKLAGKGPFVAGFAQANEGDVTPNTVGPFCSGTDIPCDGTRDTKCPGTSTCNGRGPGWEKGDLESNRIIGQNQADKAIELFEHGDELMKLSGPIDYRQKFWHISKAVVNREDGTNVSLCPSAMGYGFAAGTTDGPGLSVFFQNTTHGNPFWDFVADLLKKPSKEQEECQQPKPVLLNTGEIKVPYEWQPSIIDVQLVRIGNFFIAAVPSEMTTMSGRRLRKAIKKVLIEQGVGNNDTIVIQTLANGYASYCATYEEYQMQRYEGASTPYGPHTLDAYIQVFTELATAMAKGEPIKDSETLPDYTGKAFNLAPSFPADNPGVGKSFGDIIKDVNKDGNYSRADKPVVSATFVAGNPRNNVMLEGTFLTIEQKQEHHNKTSTWKVVRNDHDYDTRFLFSYKAKIFGLSQAKIEWHVDEEVPAGTYRIGYFGHHKKTLTGEVKPHKGYSSEFTIVP